MPIGQLSDAVALFTARSQGINPPVVLTTAGSTIGAAVAIPATPAVTGNVFRMLASASTTGAVLPAQLTWLAAGGGPIVVIPPPTVGFKLYPASGEGLKAAATSAAIVIASAKATILYPVGNAVGSSTAYRWALSA